MSDGLLRRLPGGLRWERVLFTLPSPPGHSADRPRPAPQRRRRGLG